jgi:spherulation-specific family 4 protein
MSELTRQDLAGFLRKWADDLDAEVTGVLVPLYIRPGPAWDRMEAAARAHPKVPLLAIVNPNSGPGAAKSETYASAIPKLSDSGCKVTGYVSTAYAKRPIADVKTDLGRWKDWYPQVAGIFADEMAPKATPEVLAYYSEIRRHATALGFSIVIGNPGVAPEPLMFQTSDLLVVHESATTPSPIKLREIYDTGGKGMMAALLHSASTGTVDSWVPTAKDLVRYLYVTEDALPNPWDTLSSAFERTMEILDAGFVPVPAPAPVPVPVPVPVPGQPASRLILHDWFGASPVSTPSFIKANQGHLDGLPFDGIVVYMRKPDLTDNITTGVMTAQPLELQRIVDVLAPIKGLSFRSLTSNFAAVISNTPPDFFDDWETVVQNFRKLAKAAKDAGLKGIYFDNETYFAPWTRYPDGVKYKTRSLKEYQDQAILRGRQVMEAMVAEYADIAVITLHGPYISEPKASAPLFPQWQSSNQLAGPFFVGFFAGTKAGTCVDGGELYHLRTPEEFEASYQWRKRTIASEEINCAFLPKDLRAPWPKVSIGFGVYDKPFGGKAMNAEILRSTIGNALRRADDYVWFYVEGPTFLRPPAQGGASQSWVDAVRQGRGR